MRNIFLAVSLLLTPSLALAVDVQVSKSTLTTAIDAATCAATRYTGWLQVPTSRSISFEIFFDGDAAPATTAVVMQCFASNVSTGANGTGAILQLISDSATLGTETSR